MRKFKIIFVLIAVFFGSCKINPPEPYYNSDAEAPQVYSLDLSDIEPNQHIGGTVILTFDPDITIEANDRIGLYLDGQLIESSAYLPVYFTLNTSKYQGGTHQISIGIHQSENNLGMLNLTETPGLIYFIDVYFDQAPPTATRIKDYGIKDKFPYLSWEKNNDDNFYAYFITRKIGSGVYYIDTLKNQNTISYIDSSLGLTIGMYVEYSVEVSNRAQKAKSNSISIQGGEQILCPEHVGRNFVYNSNKNLTYFMSSVSTQTLYIIDHNTQKTTSRYYPNFIKSLTYREPSNKIYAIQRKTINVIDPDTYEVLNSYNYFNNSEEFTEIFCGPGNSLIVLSFNRLYLINAENGNIIDDLFFSPNHNYLYAQNDSKTLFFVIHNNTIYKSESHLISFDVSDSQVSQTNDIIFSEAIYSLFYNDDEDKLYLTHDFFEIGTQRINYISVFNSSLQETDKIFLNLDDNFYSTYSGVLRGIASDGSYLYVGKRNKSSYGDGSLLKINLDTREIESYINSQSWFDYIYLSPDKQWLYLFYIPNNSNTNYAWKFKNEF